MKKLQILSLISSFILHSSFFISLHADEGMWTLYNLPDAVYEQMKTEGYRLPKSSLYGGLSNCVVNFSGYCTGEVVSPMGLLMTNHHCGFEAIRSHSTVEHDYMLHGFYADSISKELKNDDMFVAFMRQQRDITPTLDSLGIDTLGNIEKEALIDSLNEVLTKEAKKIDTTYYVEIDPFFEGNMYYATTYQRYNDIRLVYAPPKSLGKFGGETDNWMWPRQTCDISVFRIYVDPKTGGPADYSEHNVPMGTDSTSVAQGIKPAYLPVSIDGYREGDFSMTIGYPGSTERYLSSYGVEEMRNGLFYPMQQVRGIKQAIMKRHMSQSEAVRIKYDSKYANSSNYWKNSIGMIKCIDSIGIIDIKRKYEERIQHYADSTNIPLDFEKLKKYYRDCSAATRAMTYFNESFGRRSQNELAIRAMKYYNGIEVKGPKNKPKKQYVEFADNSDSWDKALDSEALAALIQNYRSEIGDTAYLPSFYQTIDRQFGGDYTRYVNEMYDNSILMNSGTRLKVKTTKKMQRDLGMQFGLSLIDALANIRLSIDSISDSIDVQERLLCKAKVRMEQDMPHYSDANFTMRLSYGQIGGYQINGYDSGYYTTAQSMVQKMGKTDSIEEYFAEPVFKELLSSKDFGIYTDKVSKTLNLCFLSNNDITGGNSGSPVIDGDGRLIGLAFDGNWDSLSADIYYDAPLARCINVDIRYILYIMKHWAKADRLLHEMGVE
ncbi:MAG: S46 family peptidase [Prevotella sp.]|nr:S46 family peptidase [Prevotella sp.]